VDGYRSRTFKRGEIVTGTIVYLDEDIAYIDIGANRDAVVPAREIGALETSQREHFIEGSQIDVYITETPAQNGSLVVSIERGLIAADWVRAGELLESGETGEYPVIRANQGGLLVALGGLEGFVPNSQVLAVRQQPQSRRDEVKRELVGSQLLLKVIDVDENRQRLVLSEAAARSELRSRRLQELFVGQVVTGQVVSLVPFGAFVDLDGVDGLVHISQLDWTTIKSPQDVLIEGEVIDVLVTGVDLIQERVSLSRKALLPNPWEQFARNHSAGDLLEGTVESVREFGVFVRLDEAIVGLVHVSELGDYDSRLPEDVFKPGDVILVRIIDIQVDRERASLSIRRVSTEREYQLDLKAE
jgi:small subunit ribosomal protein S1